MQWQRTVKMKQTANERSKNFSQCTENVETKRIRVVRKQLQ